MVDGIATIGRTAIIAQDGTIVLVGLIATMVPAPEGQAGRIGQIEMIITGAVATDRVVVSQGAVGLTEATTAAQAVQIEAATASFQVNDEKIARPFEIGGLFLHGRSCQRQVGGQETLSKVREYTAPSSNCSIAAGFVMVILTSPLGV